MAENKLGIIQKTKIYILLDPSGEIRYAGKTRCSLANRLSVHISKAQKGEKGHKNNWIRSLLNQQMLPTIQLVGEVTGDWQKEERAWVAYFRAEGVRLTNETDGGEGALGYIRSLETRQKVSKAMKGKKHSIEHRKKNSEGHKGQVPWMKGKKHSAESRKKLSESHKGQVNWNKGKKMSAEHCRKLSEAHKGQMPWCKGKHLSEEHRRKISENKKGQKHSAGTKRKLSEMGKGRKHSVETKLKMSKSAKRRGANRKKGFVCSEETRRRMSKAKKGQKYKKIMV